LHILLVGIHLGKKFKNKECFKFACMNLSQAESSIRESLSAIYGEGEAAAIARLLMEHLTGLDPNRLAMARNEELSEAALADLQTLLPRLLQQEPVQYVTGFAFFYGLKLVVNKAVLIPRQETEELVHWIIEDIRLLHPQLFDGSATKSDRTDLLKILDAGTGSGCIALALKHKVPGAEVWGCDLSDEALAVARRNGATLDIRVDFQQTDFLEAAQQKQLPSVDILVSNPPYIPLSGKAGMQDNVVNYEPHMALFVPDNDPLIFYRALIQFASHRLHRKGSIYAEIHEDLGSDAKKLFEEAGFSVTLRRDMQGKDRMLKANFI